MDWFPLLNSLRIAAISTVIVFFLGIFAAHYIAKLPRVVKGVLDVILTLPLVLPPTVVGWLLLCLLGPKRPLGMWVLETFDLRLVMTWWSAIFATVVVAFPLMYRTARAPLRASTEICRTQAALWENPTHGCSGEYRCLYASRAFWPVRFWPLPAHWASTAPLR